MSVGKKSVLVCGLLCIVCECGQRVSSVCELLCVECECGQRESIGVWVALCSV